jgi:ankyrin repeat protein
MGIRVSAASLLVVCCAFGQTPSAKDIFSAIRENDATAVKSLAAHRENVNIRGPRDTTPLMYAAAFGSLQSMKTLLAAGADPNAVNAFGATALMWSVSQPEKVKLLLDRKADVNIRAKSGRTALMLAAVSPGSDRVVDLLLARGADPKAKAEDGSNFLADAAVGMNAREVRLALAKGLAVDSPDAFGGTPLVNAAGNGDVASVKALLEKGANVNAVSADAGVQKVKNGNIQLGLFTPLLVASTYGPPELVEMLLRAGAKVNATDARGMTPLHYAVTSDYQNPEIIRMLLAAGADPKMKMSDGGDVSAWAAKFAIPQSISQLPLLQTSPVEAVSAHERNPSESVKQSLGLLNRVSVNFMATGGCVACHAQSIAGTALAIAKEHGIAMDDKSDAELLAAAKGRWQSMSDSLLLREDPPGGIDEEAYSALHLITAGYKSDAVSDALIVNMLSQQLPNGGWHSGFLARSPMEDSDITRTALAMRALRSLGWEGRRADLSVRAERAHQWLVRAKPVTNEDAVMQVLGLKWAADPGAVPLARALAAKQRPDGGWAQNAYLGSDAYATGQALHALIESGAFHPADAVVQRGVKYLLATQQEDGSWHVRSRSPKFQPYFQSGFPHNHDQWISMAGTGWAAMAIAEAAEPEKTAILRPAAASSVR